LFTCKLASIISALSIELSLIFYFVTPISSIIFIFNLSGLRSSFLVFIATLKFSKLVCKSGLATRASTEHARKRTLIAHFPNAVLNCIQRARFQRYHITLSLFYVKWCDSLGLHSERVNSFMQSLLQRISFYLCLRPMNNKDKMILSAAVTA